MSRMGICGKAAIVTGAGRGIGAAVATALAALGPTIAAVARAVDRNCEHVEPVAAALMTGRSHDEGGHPAAQARHPRRHRRRGRVPASRAGRSYHHVRPVRQRRRHPARLT
jgi:NAD(P)-dependent dehydrogenase (short-subunit alcohol dehydrogenase family)